MTRNEAKKMVLKALSEHPDVLAVFNIDTGSMDSLTENPDWSPVCENGNVVQVNVGGES